MKAAAAAGVRAGGRRGGEGVAVAVARSGAARWLPRREQWRQRASSEREGEASSEGEGEVEQQQQQQQQQQQRPTPPHLSPSLAVMTAACPISAMNMSPSGFTAAPEGAPPLFMTTDAWPLLRSTAITSPVDESTTLSPPVPSMNGEHTASPSPLAATNTDGMAVVGAKGKA